MPESKRTWSVSLYSPDVTQTDEALDVSVQVALSGQWVAGDRVEDVRVCALDDRGNVRAVETIGTLSENRSSTNVTMQVPSRPEVLAIGHGEVETDADRYSISGYRNTSEELYSAFYQDGPRCGAASSSAN